MDEGGNALVLLLLFTFLVYEFMGADPITKFLIYMDDAGKLRNSTYIASKFCIIKDRYYFELTVQAGLPSGSL